MKTLLTLSLAMGSLGALAQAPGDPANSAAAPAEEIFIIVEEMPQFPGGEDALAEYLGDHINYPKNARETGIGGTVYMNFTIGTDGAVRDVKLLRGIGAGCDEEALRVVKTMPKWQPGKQRGKAVNVSMNLPIRFTPAAESSPFDPNE